MRSVIASTLTAAMLATSTAPAMAQGYPHYSYNDYNRGWQGGDRYRHRHHKRGGIGAGEVIAGVAVIGILAAIASAASKSKNRNGYGDINTEDRAADACAARVEQRYSTRVRAIDDVVRTRDGYQVRGTVETRDSRDDDTQRFTCSVRFGEVEDVRLSSEYAYNGY